MTSPVWVVGARGLLGTGLVDQLTRSGAWEVIDAAPLPWASGTTADFDSTVEANLDLIGATGADHVVIAWCAGAAVTGSTIAQLTAEQEQLLRVLDLVERRGWASGTLFYASSAGGVYAGSANPPFTELTTPRPISPYGDFKLSTERAVTAFAQRTGWSALCGRISNLYGPGQSMTKAQGLITQLARAEVTGEPASLYVSLDTIRDYIFADDCAAMIADTLAHLATSGVAGETTVKIFASEQPATIAALIGTFRVLFKARTHILLGASSSSGFQARDLRFRSVVLPEISRRDLMPLPAGITRTAEAVSRWLQNGRKAS
ncbi:MAG: NAD-dependent epimerase/dehydratase family protein [Mycetocola sp.]